MHNAPYSITAKPTDAIRKLNLLCFDFTYLTYHDKHLSQHLLLLYEMIPYNI